MNLFYSLAFCLSMSSAVCLAQESQTAVTVSTPTTKTVHDYATAYRLAQTGDKPLLVLVTAEWCAPCQTLKKSTLPEMLSNGGLSGFHFAMVDVDQDATTAAKLTENRPVPQFIIFEKNGANWKKRFSIGFLGTSDLQAFLAPSLPDAVRIAAGETTNR
jgi:thioredoxin-like negative regulator of GroEL